MCQIYEKQNIEMEKLKKYYEIELNEFWKGYVK